MQVAVNWVGVGVRGCCVLLACMLAGCGKTSAHSTSAQPQSAAIPVTVATVAQQTVPTQLSAIGNVEPYSTVSIKAQVGGVLTHVYFKQGDFVRAGQLLFQIDPRPEQDALNQALANLARDKAQAKSAQGDATRDDELYKQGLISEQQDQEQAATASAAGATVGADRAAVATARLQLQYTSIYAPISGRTGALLVQAGNLISVNGSTLVTIDQIEPIYVSFAVPSDYVLPVQKDFSRHLEVTATISAKAPPARGVLTFVDNTVDTSTSTITLEATFANQDHRLWPGDFVNVVLVLNEQRNAVVVPSQAVMSGQQGNYVFVIEPGNTAEYRAVTLGEPFGNLQVITKGLEAGEAVVTNGQSRLQSGTHVKIVSGSSSSAAEGSS